MYAWCVVDLGEVVFWICVLACVYKCLFDVFVCFVLFWTFLHLGVVVVLDSQ